MSEVLHGQGPCAGCSHDPACGYASVWHDGKEDWFCHAEDHSCYVPGPPSELHRFDGSFAVSHSAACDEQAQDTTNCICVPMLHLDAEASDSVRSSPRGDPPRQADHVGLDRTPH